MQRRKDDKGWVLKDGETYRQKERRYMYCYTSMYGKRHAVYVADLNELRKMEGTEKMLIPLLLEVRKAFDNEKAYQKEIGIICEASQNFPIWRYGI